MIEQLFGADGVLTRMLGMVFDLLVFSILWAVFSVSIVTIVPASIALYDSMARCVREDEGKPYHRFFRTFRKELGRGVLLNLFWLVVGAVLFVGSNIMLSGAKNDSLMAGMGILYVFSLFLPLGVFCWSVLLESRYVSSFWKLLKTALLITVAALPYTLVVVGILVAGCVACIYFPILLLVMPGCVTMFQSFAVERVFRKFLGNTEQA